jgi:hypothetical protein
MTCTKCKKKNVKPKNQKTEPPNKSYAYIDPVQKTNNATDFDTSDGIKPGSRSAAIRVSTVDTKLSHTDTNVFGDELLPGLWLCNRVIRGVDEPVGELCHPHPC